VVDDGPVPPPYRGRVTVGASSCPAGPDLRRRWSSHDVLLAVAVGAAQLLFTTLASRHQPDRLAVDGLAVVLLLAGPAALVLRRRYPVAVLAVVFTTTLTYVAIGYAWGPIFLGLIVALFTAVMQGHRWAAWSSLGLGWVSFLWVGYLLGRDPAPTAGEMVGLAAWLLLLATTAEVVKARRERAEEAERTHREEAERRASEERLQIAQELHDVLAHNISLISVQAGVGLHLLDEQPEQARAALTAIKDASKEALGELRSVLDVLRREGDAVPRVPAPGLTADLDSLVTKAAAAGVDVRLDVTGDRQPLPPGVDRAAFRIAQEALTNVARHAGGATATLRLDYGDEALTIQVDDDGRGVGTEPAGNVSSGKGITGMRERAVALGGRLDAGPRPGGGFRVRAWLPLGRSR
jgi:signal transduction histidine kinase